MPGRSLTPTLARVPMSYFFAIIPEHHVMFFFNIKGRFGPSAGLPCCLTIDGKPQHLSAEGFEGGTEIESEKTYTFWGCVEFCKVSCRQL